VKRRGYENTLQAISDDDVEEIAKCAANRAKINMQSDKNTNLLQLLFEGLCYFVEMMLEHGPSESLLPCRRILQVYVTFWL
jgi:hypothetical protein